MLDMRTILGLTFSYSFFVGLLMIIFGLNRKKANGLIYIGSGIVVYGLGFLIISTRDYLSVFLTVIVANFLIYLGVAFILKGLSVFVGSKVKWLVQHILFSGLVLGGFLFFTYSQPNINARIIIIASVTLIMFVEMLVIIFYKREGDTRVESLILSTFFIISIVIFAIRIVISVFEAEMESFMDAGFIHSFSVIIYQVFPFVLSITTFWISNTKMEYELRHQSMIDSLTGIYNRAAILTLINKSIDMYRRKGGQFAIVMADIDHFKSVNDKFGHLCGDDTLKSVVDVLKGQIRNGDYIGRYGGEEFIMIMFDIGREELDKKLNDLRTSIKETKIGSLPDGYEVTASFGGVVNQGHYNLDDLIKVADDALYKAKDLGRDKVVIDDLISQG